MGMSSKKHQIPAIRFKGFTDAWEQRKLGDIADIKDSARISNELWVENGIPYLRSSDLVNGELNGELFISKETYEGYASKTGAPQKDDVLFTSGGKVGVVYHKKDESPVYVQGGAVLYVKTSTSNLLDGSFLSIYFGSPRMQTYMDIASSGGTIKHFTLKPANASPIIFPGLSEQQKIGAFFKELDKTIALHQRQSDTYKELKKSMLQKMFPQDGEKVPEIRFDGFTEEWERRSLNSIVKRVTRKNKNLESSLPLTISAQHGLVDQNTFFNKQVASKDVSGYYLVKKGEFAYNKSYSSGYPWGAIKRLDNYDMGVLSTLYIVFQPVNIVSDFLVTYYDTNLWHKEVSMRAAEGARNHGLLNISAQDFFETELIISTNTEEQARIGCYFKQLDDTIALHKQKTTCLQILKNSLLNKMFI